jgi:hypothetical protein
MPSSDKPEEPVDQPVPEGNEVVGEELTLPDNASERTKEQFEKLKARLKEKDEALRQAKALKEQVSEEEPVPGSSVFDSFRPQVPMGQPANIPLPPSPYLNPLQVQNLKTQFIDGDGNVDVEGLNRAITESNQRAFEASQRAQALEIKLAQIEENEQVREAHAAFPEIDPVEGKKRGVFDKALFKAIRDRVYTENFVGNQNRRFIDIVKEVKAELRPETKVDTSKIEQEAVEKYKQTQQARNQGPFESGRGEPDRQSDLTDLRARTRKGGQVGDQALAERLKALGI